MYKTVKKLHQLPITATNHKLTTTWKVFNRQMKVIRNYNVFPPALRIRFAVFLENMPEILRGSWISKDLLLCRHMLWREEYYKNFNSLPQEIVSSFLHMQHPAETVNLCSPQHQLTYQCWQIIRRAKQRVALEKLTCCN